MKRVYWFLLFSVIVSSLYYCTKSKVQDSIALQPAKNAEASGQALLQSRATDKQGGSVCSCQTSQLSCRADCYLSDCCVCWNPNLENGSCGCYFGVAKCITGPIGKASTSKTMHPVKVYTSRVSSFISALGTRGIQTDTLQSRYREMLTGTNTLSDSGTDPFVEVPADRYRNFFEYYTSFMQKADSEIQQWVITYLQMRASVK